MTRAPITVMGPIDAATRRRHKRRNVLQALLLVASMVTVAAVAGFIVAGRTGLLWVAVLTAVALAWRPEVSPDWVLRMYGAQPLPPATVPDLHLLVRALSERAGLPQPPRLYYVPTAMLNAFAVGRREEAAIGVTDGLLRTLPGRELAGVLAHEICHIRSDDLWIMTLTDTVGRVAHGVAYAGLLLLVAGLPILTVGYAEPLLVAGLLAALPTATTLLQLALSRSREYDADLEAATLTGDPDALAAALQRLERHEGRVWERILVPHRRVPDPFLLRTHPPTEERVRRLRALVPQQPRRLPVRTQAYAPEGYNRVTRPVRLRYPGIRW